MPPKIIATAASTRERREAVRESLNEDALRKAQEAAARKRAAEEAALRNSKSPSPKPRSKPGSKGGIRTRALCVLVKKPRTTGKSKTGAKQQQKNNVKKTKGGRVAKDSGNKGRKVKKETDVAAHDSDDSEMESAESITTAEPAVRATKRKQATKAKGNKTTKAKATTTKEKKKTLSPKRERVVKFRTIKRSLSIESSGEGRVESDDEEDKEDDKDDDMSGANWV
ncbi:uncharacterized protein J4E88_001525 [Alternaria novae-zelandiae]|uniref:uncharacterized protein n=1 Tax=Alternaria novae-zelandiae TaxID=430562 RepID=UPI0020C2E706|nr:uncharacterized protein J4E88_001525 [Alternaria novae-zelandiae]KAI4693154.1 hypothetical protein J4E88_001525 [Alternaria novae-zelandiae]